MAAVSTPERPSTGSPSLLLFPTELERRRFLDQGGIEPGHVLSAISGFGPVVSAARTARLLATLRPRRVFLLGIAGAYDAARHPIGEALVFSRVTLDGVGAGRGKDFLSPARLGFPQWPAADGRARTDDVVELAHPPGRDDGLLLSTCAAAATRAEADERVERFPEAVAEDMEGFAVALACALAGVPATIVRGVSNQVGDRDPARWRIPAALAAARRALLALLEEGPG